MLLNKVGLGSSGSGSATSVHSSGGLTVDLGPPQQLLLAGRHVLPGPGLEAGGLQSSPEGECEAGE